MRNAPHLVGLVLRTWSRTKCVYLMSHVLDAGWWTYLKETEAVERGLRITKVIDGYAVVQVRSICQAPNATDALIVGQMDQAKSLRSMPGYTRQLGITMPLSRCYSSPHAAVNALKEGASSSQSAKMSKSKPWGQQDASVIGGYSCLSTRCSGHHPRCIVGGNANTPALHRQHERHDYFNASQPQ